jgi:hypothetical protein
MASSSSLQVTEASVMALLVAPSLSWIRAVWYLDRSTRL